MAADRRGAPHGVADLAEFGARMAELRATLAPAPPTEVGAYLANTDGACLGNPDGPGGWAAVVDQLRLEPASATWELWGHLSSTSNNRAEALGVLAALAWVPPGSEVLIRSDSELTIRILAGLYKARANADVWSEIRRAVAERGLRVRTEWVRGHAGDPGNERADALSLLGAVAGDTQRWRQLRTRPRGEPQPASTRPARVPPELVGLVPRGAWEAAFVASISRQLQSGQALSDKQRAVLDRIRARGR